MCKLLPYYLHLLSPWAHLHVVGMFQFMVWHKPAKFAHFFLFSCCVYFCPYDHFNCTSFHKFSQQLSTFSICSSGLTYALLVLSTIYLFMKVSFSPDIILCGWLGLKNQLTKYTFTAQKCRELFLCYHMNTCRFFKNVESTHPRQEKR